MARHGPVSKVCLKTSQITYKETNVFNSGGREFKFRGLFLTNTSIIILHNFVVLILDVALTLL